MVLRTLSKVMELSADNRWKVEASSEFEILDSVAQRGGLQCKS